MRRDAPPDAPILQSVLPHTPWADPALARMPGLRPVAGSWIVVDDAYAAQMALRERLLRDHRDAVLAGADKVRPAQEELMEEVLRALPDGFVRAKTQVTCPDGRMVPLGGPPFEVLNRILQEDLLILDKPAGGAEHILQAALLCFPAYWRLADKIGRPLTRIHDPVPEYDGDIAGRVQRLFDRTPPGRPMWRANVLPHSDATLHRPAPIREAGARRYIRSERQTLLRLPRTGAMVFAVHTFIVDRADLTPAQRASCPV